MDCKTSLGFITFLGKQREERRQLKAGLQQVELLVLTGIRVPSTAIAVWYVCAESRSEGKVMLGSRNWSEARC